MSKKQKTITKAELVRVGDKAKVEGLAAFVVAGVRRNPLSGQVRLFDDESVLRTELDPGASVEVER